MSELLLRPNNASYAVAMADEVLFAQLDGGAGKYRTDILDGSRMVDVDWQLTARQFEYMQAFRRTNNALPFTIKLIIDTPDLITYTARFKTPFKIGQKGATYYIGCQLEVEAIAGISAANPSGVTKSSDADIITAFEADPLL